MKKVIYLVPVIFLFFCCGQKQEKVEKHIEDGIEVILNHMEPYQIKGELANFDLEEILAIDSGSFQIARTGLTDIGCFDVDSKGNIYFLKPRKGSGDNIFKFDKNGRFVTSFGPNGQGPGEFQRQNHLEIDYKDNIVVTDIAKQRLVIFNKDCRFMKELPIELGIMFVSCLDNGKFLTFGQDIKTIRDDVLLHALKLVNPQLEEIKELDRYKYIYSSKRPTLGCCWSISNRFIYVGNEERGYEIWKFDLKGNLIQKIKKEYKRISISEDYKRERLERTPEMIRKKISFHKFFPPYQSFFTDERGRLFVLTYEKGENSSGFMIEIFNPDGAFIGKKSSDFQLWHDSVRADIRVKQNFLYSLQEKESGYKELVVYKVKWK